MAAVEFSWASAADVGLSILGKGISAWNAGKSAELQAELENSLRAAQNLVNRSKGQLTATVRHINNNRILRQGGEQMAALLQNALRTQDSLSAGRFEDSIRAAEAAGGAAVAAAAAGVGGAGIEAISRTVALTNARRQAQADRQQAQVAGDAQRQASNIMAGALEALQIGPVDMGQDYRRSVPKTTAGGALAAGLIEGLLGAKDSLHTMLGSLQNRAPVQESSLPLSVNNQPGAYDFAFTTPVSQSTVTGVDLAPLQATQADVRRVDNAITLN